MQIGVTPLTGNASILLACRQPGRGHPLGAQLRNAYRKNKNETTLFPCQGAHMTRCNFDQCQQVVVIFTA